MSDFTLVVPLSFDFSEVSPCWLCAQGLVAVLDTPCRLTPTPNALTLWFCACKVIWLSAALPLPPQLLFQNIPTTPPQPPHTPFSIPTSIQKNYCSVRNSCLLLFCMCLCTYFVCLFSLPLCVIGWQQLGIVALPRLSNVC